MTGSSNSLPEPMPMTFACATLWVWIIMHHEGDEPCVQDVCVCQRQSKPPNASPLLQWWSEGALSMHIRLGALVVYLLGRGRGSPLCSRGGVPAAIGTL